MRYVAIDDLRHAIPERSLIQLSNDDPAAQAPDLDVIERTIQGAEELVDGYLRARYVLPLAQVPTVIRNLTMDVVRYRLYARRPEGNALPETVRDQHDAALRTLDHIQSGKITLGIASSGQATPEPGAMRVSAPRRQFDKTTFTQWR